MRKTVIILISLFIISGCYNYNLNDVSNINREINNVIVNSNSHPNIVGNGFKYYKPRDFSVRVVDVYNHELTHDGDKYYLSVDINAYYNKAIPQYEIQENNYYSYTFNYNSIYGYVDVIENNSYFYIKMMYNYSYMEVRVNEEDISEAITNSLIILSSIKYNDGVIEKTLLNSNKEFTEETYELDKPDIENKSNILNYYE